jgi:hypothetical protein
MFKPRLQKKEIYIFTHIPKTGGTTLRVHFQKYLDDQVEFIHLANKGHKWAAEKGLKEFPDRPQNERERAKVILGHQVNFQTKNLVPNLSPIEIVFFRDPIQWEISRFNQFVNRQVNEGKEIITFQKWINSIEKTHSQFDWFLSYYLNLKANVRALNPRSKENLLLYTLENFKHVYFLDDFKQKTNQIFKCLDIPINPPSENIVGKHKVQYYLNNEENLKLISKVCEKDMLIYNKLKKIYK